jgi:DNA-binding NtrC family response regulator
VPTNAETVHNIYRIPSQRPSWFAFSAHLPDARGFVLLGIGCLLPFLGGSAMQRRILVADNDSTGLGLQKLVANDPDLQVDDIKDGAAALQALSEQNYSIFLMDLMTPSLGGLGLMEEIHKRNLPVTVIVMTGPSSIDQAVQAMRLGAYDILTKPVDAHHVRLVVERVLRERRLQDEVASLREQLQNRYAFRNIISKSPRMHAVFELIANVAQTNTTVLIEGETGTGKEQVALAIHHASQLRTGPMIAVNCAALPETLLESELFGHEKGAFTSAVGKRVGRFELANGGTIFLDEVGDIPPAMQAKLLRVLQERRFERVGGTESIEVDVRVIGATNRSLQKLVQEGKFREDLYYRLNVVKIDLPPLRERREDIPLLAAYFAGKYARAGEAPKRIPPQAMDVLLSYSWPGNIRELENAIERACVTSPNGSLLVENFPPDVLQPPAPKLPLSVDLHRPLPDLLRQILADIEQEYIRKALEQTRGNVSQCAHLCGISRRSLSAKLGEYQINKAVFKDIVNGAALHAHG